MSSPRLKLRILPERPDLPLPAYQTIHAAGLDIPAASVLELLPGKSGLVKTGFEIEIPVGYEAQVRPRSGLAMRHGVTVLNAPGTIDADYRGELQVLLINLGDKTYRIEPGDRIAQLVISPVVQVQVEPVLELSATERGRGGFGHSGR